MQRPDVEGSTTTSVEPLRTRWPTGYWGKFVLHVGVFAIYAAGAVALFHRAWAAPSSRLIGGCCDSDAYVDTFRWTGAAVLHAHNPLFSHLANAPSGVNVMWQPNVLPLVGLLSTPFQPLFGPMTTYNLMMTLALAFDGLACFVALRRWVGGWIGPFVGGAFFAFSPTMTSHSLGHAQITWAALVPLALVLAIDIVVEQRWRWWLSGIAFGVVLAAQLLVGEEVLADLCLACAVVGVVSAALYRRRLASHVAHAAKALVVGALTAGVLAVWPLATQFLGSERITSAFRDTRPFGVNVASYVVPLPGLDEFGTSWTATHAVAWFGPLGLSETNAYIGIPLIGALTAVAVLRWRRPVVRTTAIATLVVMVLSLGTHLQVGGSSYNIWLPWRIFHALPLFRDLQPNRMSLFVDLGLAVLMAEGVHAVAAAKAPALRIVGALAALVALTPLLPTVHYPTYTPSQPAFFTTTLVDAIPSGSTVLLAPFPRGAAAADADPMVWQSDSGLRFKIPGGGIFVPNSQGANTEGGAPEPLSIALGDIESGQTLLGQTPPTIAAERSDLASWGVTSVVVGPMPRQWMAVDLMTLVLARPPLHLGGVYLWTGVSEGSQVAAR